MQCDICGKEKPLFRVKIERTIMSVCTECKRFGTEITIPVLRKKFSDDNKGFLDNQETETIIHDYAKRIKDAREAMKLKQEDFAKKINEKESLIHQVETGHFEPSIGLARKMEKFLGIRLIESVKPEDISKKGKKEDDVMTLGHLLKK
jgi:uncharacterized protein (TIGR00270 family)